MGPGCYMKSEEKMKTKVEDEDSKRLSGAGMRK